MFINTIIIPVLQILNFYQKQKSNCDFSSVSSCCFFIFLAIFARLHDAIVLSFCCLSKASKMDLSSALNWHDTQLLHVSRCLHLPYAFFHFWRNNLPFLRSFRCTCLFRWQILSLSARQFLTTFICSDLFSYRVGT